MKYIRVHTNNTVNLEKIEAVEIFHHEGDFYRICFYKSICGPTIYEEFIVDKEYLKIFIHDFEAITGVRLKVR